MTMREGWAREELRFIYQVMREANRSIRSLHRILIFLGVLSIVGSLGTYLLRWLYPPLGTEQWYWFWLGYWIGPVVIFLAHELWRQRWYQPASWGEKLLWILWGSCLGGGILIGALLPYIAVEVRAAWGVPLSQYALIGWDEFLKWAPIAVLLGVALFLTAYIYRVSGLTIAGLGCWATAVLLAVVPPEWASWTVGFGLGPSFLYAGWRLKQEQEHHELQEALQRFKELVYEASDDDT